MRKGDWIGLVTSLTLHALLLLGFFLVTAAQQPLTAGFVEVEFGPLSRGRPVQQAVEPESVEAPAVDETKDELPRPSQDTKPVGKLVQLPRQRFTPPEPETVRVPDTEKVGANEATTAAETVVEGAARVRRDAREGGESAGSTGASTGDAGTGAEEKKSSPYQLEGLEDRSLLREVLPRYAEKVNAIIQMRISVDTRGQVVRIIPLRKGNPELERAVMEALLRWRFDPLNPNAPQELQTGIVTFRFRLE
jgi:protein TonB